MSLRQLDLPDVGAPTPKLLVMTSTKMGTKQSFLQGRAIEPLLEGTWKSTFYLLGALLEKQSSTSLGLASTRQKEKPKEFMTAIPAMLMLSALRKLLVFLINHYRYVPTAAKVYNCNDAVITILELELA